MKLHKQLFRTLEYQAFIPLFTAYFPAATCVIFPLTGLPFENFAVFCPFACGTHPLIDPIVLLFTITSYRGRFLEIIRVLPLSDKPVAKIFMSTSVQSKTAASIHM